MKDWDAHIRIMERSNTVHRLDDFIAAVGNLPVIRERVAEASDGFEKRALALLSNDNLPTLRKLFRDCREVGAYVPLAEVSDDKRDMLAAPVASLVADGLMTDDGKEWALTKRGLDALTVLDSDDLPTIEAVLFPEGRPTREDLQERLESTIDRAAIAERPILEFEAQRILGRRASSTANVE